VIRLTPQAARQLQISLEENADDALALRVAARRCSDGALEYAMGLDEPREGDLQLEEKGVPLLIGVASRDLLANTQIDFVEYEPGEFRFIFIAGQACVGASGNSQANGAAEARACRDGSCSGCGQGPSPSVSGMDQG
jgi:iron-sulfur cluster assembly protein